MTHPMWWVLVGSGVTLIALGVAANSRWARATVPRVEGR
jgi:hypothetical protein